MRVLVTLQHPYFLISAYDIFHTDESTKLEMRKLIGKANDNGVAILLDSGNYESYWRRDSNWTSDKFISVLEAFDSVCALGFDMQNPDAHKARRMGNCVAHAVQLETR